MGRWIALGLVLLCATLGYAPAQDQERVAIYPQLGHSFYVVSVAFSPDGRTLASGSWDGSIRLWDVASGRVLRTLHGHSYGVASVAFSPNGRTFASAGGVDATIKLWDAASGRVLATFSGHPGGVESVAFSPDGQTLASGGRDRTVKLWDLASGHELRTLSGHSGTVNAVAFSPDGRTLASGSQDKTVRLWDAASGRELRSLNGHPYEVNAVSFSHDGRTLVSVGGAVALWDVASGRQLRTLSHRSYVIRCAAFSPDDGMLASGNANNTINLWDPTNGREIAALSGHSDWVESVVFSPDGRILASGSQDNTIKLWDAANGRELRTLSGHSAAVESIAFSPRGRMLAAASRDHTVKLWDLATGRILGTLSGHSGWVNSVAFSPDRRTLASGSSDHTIKLWDVASGRDLRTLSGHTKFVSFVVFSPDGGTLASGSGDHTIKLWDVASGRELRTLSGHSDAVWSVAFSPDGRTLASGSSDHAIKLWDVASGRELRTLGGHSTSVNSVVFSPDGRLLASAIGNAVTLWDASSGREIRTLTGHSGSIAGRTAFSPDGRTLASGYSDDTIQLWDVASGHALATLVEHLVGVDSVAFSPDGKTLAVGGEYGTVPIWDLATRTERVALVGFSDGSSLVVTPQGFFDSSSEQAEDNLNVRIDNRVFGVSSFRDNFYRPDLVQKALHGEDISQYGSIDNVKLSPEVEFAGLPSATSDPNLKVTLNLTNGGGGFGPIRVFWNGTVVQQDSDVPMSGATLSRSYTVPLLNGDNEVRATTFNADGSMWSEARSTVAANLPVTKLAGAHGTLHAVVVGIQDFPNAPSHNLKYDAADAKLIADTLTQKAQPLFDKLDIELLSPEQSDKDHIVGALKAMQASAGPDDEFVFYAASHGIVVGSQYYLLASDMVDPPDTANLSAHALSVKELGDLLSNIHAGKKLVILDTCDSGAASHDLNAGSGVTAQTTATVLGRDLGFTVLAATDSNQDALEGGSNGHGLFTYVLNDGLSGKAVDQATGIVTSFLLADYVRKQVPALAQSILHHEQQPTTETSGQSFAVTKVR